MSNRDRPTCLSIIALLLVLLQPELAAADMPDLIIRNVHILSADGTGEPVVASIRVRNSNLQLISTDPIQAEPGESVYDGGEGFVLGNLVLNESAGFIVLKENPVENVDVLLDTKQFVTFAVSQGEVLVNELPAGRDAASADRQSVRSDYQVPPAALPTAYSSGPDWYTWRSRYFDGLFVSALVLDRQKWSQDGASIQQFGDLSSEFERGTIRGFRFGIAGTINFDTPWLYAIGGAANGFDRGFDTEEVDDFEFFDVRVDVPLSKSALVSIGKQKEPISMERLMALVELSAFERTVAGDGMLPSRNWGVVVKGTAVDQRVTWSGGLFNDWFTGGDSFSDNASQVVGRVTWLPYLNDDESNLVHVGVGVRHTNAREGLQYKTRPEMGNSPLFVDTGLFEADSSVLINYEASWRRGPFWLLAEYSDNRVDAPASGDPNFRGYNIGATWALTGEMRPYYKARGVFRSLPVAQDVNHGGKGAFEIGVRYSSLDLTDGLIAGGEIDVATMGLNWWLTNKMMFGINLKRSWTDRFGLEGVADSYVARVLLTL